MAAAPLPRPGVEVIQTFRTISPTVVTPTLVASIVGACKQVVSAVSVGATGANQVNTEALVDVPAVLTAAPATGDPPVYTVASPGNVAFEINGGQGVLVAFLAATYSPSAVVDLVNAALADFNETSAVAEVLGTTQWRIRTVNANDYAYIKVASVSDKAITTAIGLDVSDFSSGANSYGGYQLTIPHAFLPDPRGNMDELAVEPETVRMFLGMSGGLSLFETLRTQSIGRHGGGTVGDAAAIDDGNGDNLTPFIQMRTQDFTGATLDPQPATLTGAGTVTLANIVGKTLIISDGRAPKTIVFEDVQQGDTLSADDIADQIQGAFNVEDGLLCTAGSSKLTLTSTRLREDGLTPCAGEDSAIVFYGGTALVPDNKLDAGPNPHIKIGRTSGRPYQAYAGDEVYVDGVFVGKVTQVAPHGMADTLKLDRQIPLTFQGTHYYILAKNLLSGQSDRPAPDLLVDGVGNATLKLGILRDTTGAIVETATTTALIPGKSLMYADYKALRLDVTPRAANPGLLRFDDTLALSSQLSPISPDNPLALGLYFALLNSPGTEVTGLGVDQVSADYPYGTVESFTRAAEYLESYEVYAIAPMTHTSSVADVFRSHVDYMSSPEGKGERICLYNPSRPTAKLDTTVGSGSGNGISTTQFDTGIGNLTALLLAQGINPVGTIPVNKGLFLDIASTDKHYSITAVSGSIITVKTTFTTGNDDGFYSTAALPSLLIDEVFALRIRGAELVNTDGTPNKAEIANTYSAMGQAQMDRRMWMIVPDTCEAVLEGLPQNIPGFYMSAMIAGAIGQQPPQQSFTNFPITGATRVLGSNDYFSEKQLNIMAGGGCYIMVQDAPNSPLMARMALTTDMTSIETRTDSITKVVDFVAKFYRRGLKNFIGRFNITQGFLDSLGHVLEGLGDFLKGAGVLIGAYVNNIVQDESSPDVVLIDITLDVPYPCNYIRVTLVI